jgi:hypothetical protein
MLQARSHVDATPNVCGVIGFDNVFAAIVEPTVTDEEAESSISEIGLVILITNISNDVGLVKRLVACFFMVSNTLRGLRQGARFPSTGKRSAVDLCSVSNLMARPI